MAIRKALEAENFDKYMEFHKVSLKEYQEVSQKIISLLSGRELSASEIRKGLNSKSNIPAIIQIMCNSGLLIRGKPIKDWKDRRNKYTLFKNYFPNLVLTKLIMTAWKQQANHIGMVLQISIMYLNSAFNKKARY